VEFKTAEQFALMRRAGLIVARTLALLRDAVAPGVTTGELDKLAEEAIRAADGIPSFLGYLGYPASICASVNDEVVHAIPGPRVLREGDLISIDCGAIHQGWHGDAAITVPVGAVDDDARRLSEVTEQSMWHGIAAFRAGNRLSDIGAAVSGFVASRGDYGVVREYGGHGIGTRMHMDPMVYNYRRRRPRLALRAGMALAIEPMVTLGGVDTVEMDDEWTVRTADGSVAAHWEHTVALTDDGPWVLTALDGGRAELAKLGVAVPDRE
jgi:methionyl aminopeptidase